MRIRALDRKLLRDLWRMRIHAIAVSLVLGCGLSVFVMAVGMRASLEQTRTAYYLDKRMADLSVSLVRAPERAGAEIARIPGVASVETRIAGLALLDMPQMDEPASARLVSLPREGRPTVNDLALARGRWPDPAYASEVLLNEAFATAAGLDVDDTLSAVLYGRKQHLRVVGIANSPEFVFVAAPGELFPQPERFGVIWMSRDALGRAFDLDGAFNEAVIRLAPGAGEKETADAILRQLERYGAHGVYGRDRMMSDRFLTEEIKQLATMATFLPAFFLIIAAFLVNIAMGRIIATERSNIGLLKSFGYSDTAVAIHYSKNALILAAGGALLGCVAGVALGRMIATVYRDYYNFPQLDFSAPFATFVFAWLAAIGAAGVGALVSVMRAARLSPAAALAPPQPTAFQRKNGWIMSFGERLDAKTRIIMRRILRFPRRAASTSIGVAFAIALLVVAQTFPAVMDRLLSVHFNEANRQDVTLSFAEPRGMAALHAVNRLPGVIAAEPFRVDDVMLHYRGRSVNEAIFGVPRESNLSRVIGSTGEAMAAPVEGVVLARALAAKLGASTGDVITIEQTGGRRVRAQVIVEGISTPMVGASAYMELGALSSILRETDRISGAHIRLDTAALPAFNASVKSTPVLAGASYIGLAERSMRRSFEEGVGFMNVIYGAFAAVMAGGVAFSAARITFAEQARDLATLRVLGFTRMETSYVLVGELMVLALVAIPAGCLIGTGLAMWLMKLFETDMYNFPYVFNPGGYAYAVTFTLACVAAAALVVRQGIDRLDMVAVLKARA